MTSLAILVTLAIAGTVVYLRTRDALHDQLDASLTAKARALAQLVEYDDEDGLETDLSPEAAPGDYFELWNDKGDSMLRSRSLADAHLARNADRTALTLRDARLANGTHVRQVQLVFPPRQERSEETVHAEGPLVTLALASSTASVDATAGTIRSIILAVGALAILIALALLAWLIRVGLRPVNAVATAIGAIDADNLAASKNLPAVPAELQPISDRLAALLARLDRAFTRERELTGEVAHELRTPLAGLRSTIEVALGKERAPERYRETLAECLAICAQAERTVEMLLALARLDATTTAPVTSEPVALDEIARESATRVAAAAAPRSLTIETKLTTVSARIDRDQVRVVVDNLIDNAIAYADQGGTVEIETQPLERSIAGPDGPTSTRMATLRVSNTCTTLGADQVEHVFERFWRADRARTAGHAGLGLAMCKKLVERAGGTITAELRDGVFYVTVTFDSAAAARYAPTG